MDITIKNLQKRIPINPNRIQRILKTVLRREGVKACSLSLAFVTDQKIQALNRTFHRRDYPTDVLSFDLSFDSLCQYARPIGAKPRLGGASPKKRPPRPASLAAKRRGGRNDSVIVGEIIISSDTVSRHSKIYQTTLQEELELCLIHGVLHLLGFDDHKPSDIKRMRQKEQELLALVTS